MDKSRLLLSRKNLDKLFEILDEDYSRREIAEKLNVNTNTLKHWRTGFRTMPFEVAERIKRLSPSTIQIIEKATILPDDYWASKGGKAWVRTLSKQEMKEKMRGLRNLRVGFSKPITVDLTKNDLAIEFFGVMIGDGCLCKYYSKTDKCNRYMVFITGNSLRDRKYFEDFLIPLVKKTFNVHAYLRTRRTSNTIDIMIRNKEMFFWLNNNGFPIGVKGQISIPSKLFSLGFQRLKPLIRGIFDTDGCVSARKSENYSRPFAIISSHSVKLRKQVKTLLRGAGYPAYDSGHNVGINGRLAFKKWFNEIGSNNPRNLDRYRFWLTTGKLKMLDI